METCEQAQTSVSSQIRGPVSIFHPPKNLAFLVLPRLAGVIRACLAYFAHSTLRKVPLRLASPQTNTFSICLNHGITLAPGLSRTIRPHRCLCTPPARYSYSVPLSVILDTAGRYLSVKRDMHLWITNTPAQAQDAYRFIFGSTGALELTNEYSGLATVAAPILPSQSSGKHVPGR